MLPFLAVAWVLGAAWIGIWLALASQTSLITHVTIAFLRRALHQLCRDSAETDQPPSEGLKVLASEGGFCIQNVVLKEKVLSSITGGPIQFKRAAVKEAVLQWPTWTLPCRIRIQGAVLEMQQRQLPKAQSSTTPWKHKEQNKLKILEQLLWSGPSPKISSSKQRLVEQLVHWGLQLLVRALTLELQETALLYVQDGEPGPPASPHLPPLPGQPAPPPQPEPPAGRRDAVMVEVRSISFGPTTKVGKSAAPATAASVPASTPAKPGRAAMPAGSPQLARGTGSSTPTRTGASESGARVGKAAQGGVHRAQGTQLTAADILGGLGARDSAAAEKTAALRRLLKTAVKVIKWRQQRQPEQPGRRLATAARLAISGVRVLLLTKNPQDASAEVSGASGVSSTSSGKAKPAGGVEANTAATAVPGLGSSTLWVRGRRVRVSPVLRGHAARLQAQRQQQQQAAASEEEAAASNKLPLTDLAAWDAAHCLLQQWGAELEASWRLFKGKPADGSSVLGAKARGYVDGLEVQPALVVTASFGVRSKDDLLKSAAGLDGVPAVYDNSGAATPVRPAPSAGVPAPKGVPIPQQSHSSGLQIKLSAHLNALVLSVDPESAVVALRIVNRFLQFSKYQQYWARRPTVPVSKAPALWWQHASESVMNTCRERFPIRHFGDTLKLRQEYMGVYADIKRRTVPFVHNPSVGRRKAAKGTPAAAAIAAAAASAAAVRVRAAKVKAYAKESLEALEHRLSHLEAKLTLAQVVTYRTCVALQHSQYILSHPDGGVAADWKTLLDTLNVFVDAHPTLEDDADMNVLLSNDDTAEHSKTQSMLRWKLRCPRVGIRLVAKAAPPIPSFSAASVASGGGDRGSARAPPVLALMIEDVAVSIPDGHHVAAKANIIRLGMASDNIVPSVLIPASPAFLRETLPKYDPPVNDFAEGRGRAFGSMGGAMMGDEVPHRELPPVFLSSSDRMRGTLHGEAPISEYLPRLKVSIAPVEVHLATQTGIEFVGFVRAFAVALNRDKPASSRQHESGSSSGGSSLAAMVIDSYVRNGVKVPSALAQLPPKAQVVCPRIAVQVPIEKSLLAKAYREVPYGYNFQLNLIKLRTCVAYTTTPYGELAQSMSTNFDLEAAINLASPQPRLTHLAARLWLHPADAGAMDIATAGARPVRRQASASALVNPSFGPSPVPAASKLSATPSFRADRPTLRRHLATSRVERGRSASFDGGAEVPMQQPEASAASAPPASPAMRSNMEQRRSEDGRQASTPVTSLPRDPASGTVPPPTSFSSRYKCLHPSIPFVPIIRIKSLSVVSIRQVPLEPTVPGHSISHHSVSMFGAMVWWTAFSVDALLTLVEQAMLHPAVSSNLRDEFAGPKGTPATAQQPSPAAAASPPAEAQAARQQEAASGPSSTSKTSVLIDVPLLTVMLYARMDDNIDWSAPDLGQKLVPARWLLSKNRKTGAHTLTDPDSEVMALEGLRLLTPLISLNLVDLRVGGRLDGRNTELQLSVGALHSENHQLRMQGIHIWQANSSNVGRPRAAAGGVTSPFVYSLASSDARTLASEKMARARARVVLGVDIRLAQVYRRVLEMQLLLRASDYAFFLLTTLDKPDIHGAQIYDQPYEYYRRLCYEVSGEVGPLVIPGPGRLSNESAGEQPSGRQPSGGPERSGSSLRGAGGGGSDGGAAARLLASGGRRLLQRSAVTFTHGQPAAATAPVPKKSTLATWLLQGVRRRMPKLHMPRMPFSFRLRPKASPVSSAAAAAAMYRVSPQPRPAQAEAPPVADHHRRLPPERSESWQAALRCLPFTHVKKPELSFLQVFDSMHFIQRDGKQRSCSRLEFRTPNLQLHLNRPASASAMTSLQFCASFLNLNLCTYSSAALIRMFMGSGTLMTAKLARIQQSSRQTACGKAAGHGVAHGPAPASHSGTTASTSSPAQGPTTAKVAGSGGATASVSIDVQIMAVSVRLLVEESPGVKRPGATQVLAATLANTQLTFGPPQLKQRRVQRQISAARSAAEAASRSDGTMALRCSVGDVRVKDLQGCVEHRGVLTANRASNRTAPATPPSSPTRRTAPSTPPATGNGTVPPASGGRPGLGTPGAGSRAVQAVKKANCTLRVLVVLPPSHLAHINPVTVTVTLDNAKVIFLRRFLANTLYAVNKLLQGLKPLKGHFGYTGDDDVEGSPATGGDAAAPASAQARTSHAGQADADAEGRDSAGRSADAATAAAASTAAAATAAAAPAGASPVVLIQLRNTKVLLPASSAAKRGHIKHQVHSDGLGVAIREVQMCLPLGPLSGYPAQVAALQTPLVQEFLSVGPSATKDMRRTTGAAPPPGGSSATAVDDGGTWMLDPEATAKMLLSGYDLYVSHARSQQAGGQDGSGKQRKGQHDGGGVPGNVAGDGTAVSQEPSMGAAPDTGGRWQSVKNATRRLVVKPLQDIVAEAKKMAIASDHTEQGTLYLDVDLDEDLDKLPPHLATTRVTEQVARFTQDDYAPAMGAGNVRQTAGGPVPAAAADSAPQQPVQWAVQHQAGAAREEAGVGGASKAGSGANAGSSAAATVTAGVAPGGGGKGDGRLRYASKSASASAEPDACRREAEARELQPILLFAVRSLEAFSCSTPSLACSSTSLEVRHSSLEHRALLDALGRWTEEDALGIMLPSDLDGAVMKQGLLGALQLHLGIGSWDADDASKATQESEEERTQAAAEALVAGLASKARDDAAAADGAVIHKGRMDVVLDPRRYGGLMPVCLGNMVEGASVFELVESEKAAAAARDQRVWNTIMTQVLAFGPGPADLPSFVMTAGWSHLRATFMNCRTWWDPREGGKAAAGQAEKRGAGDEAVPFLEVDLKGLSFSLQMMQGSNNLHIATHCREAKVSDVRGQHSRRAGTPAAGTSGQQGKDGMAVPPGAAEDSRSSSRDSSRRLQPAGQSGPIPSPSKQQAADDAAALLLRRAATQHRPSKSWTSLPTVEEILAPPEPELRGWARAAAAVRSGQGSQLLLGEHVPPLEPAQDQRQGKAAAGASDYAKVVESAPGGSKVVILQALPVLHEALHLQPVSTGGTGGAGGRPPTRQPAAAGATPAPGEASDGFASSSHDNLQVSFHMRADGTMACEVHLCHALLQWPYLTDMSLASAMVSIFQPTWCMTVPTTIDSLPAKIFHDNGGWPWLYFNLLITNSEVFVPVMSSKLRESSSAAVAALEAAAAYNAARGGSPQLVSRAASQSGTQPLPPQPQPQPQPQPSGPRTSSTRPHPRHVSGASSAHGAAHEGFDDVYVDHRTSPSSTDPSIARLSNTSVRRHGSERKPPPPVPDHQLLCWSALTEVFRSAVAQDILDGGTRPSTPGQPLLRETGLALSLGAMRFGYFMGGDGQSRMLVDLRNTAGFARHRAALVTNFLLPIQKLSVNLASECPRVAEGYTLRQMVLLARRTLFVYRTQNPAYLLKRRNRRAGITSGQSMTLPSRPGLGQVAAAAMMTFQEEMQQRSQRAAVRRRFMPAHMALLSDAWDVAEGLLAESRQQPPAGGLTGNQHVDQQASVHLLPKGWKMPAPAMTKVQVEAEVLRVRLAFSHIPLLHALLDDAAMAGAYMSKGPGMFPKPVHVLLEEAAAAPAAARQPGGAPTMQQDLVNLRAAFRPSCVELEAKLREASVVLCNDKPNSFGAPDVLQANIESLSARRLAVQRFARGQAEQSMTADTSVSVNFLNDALGRWERAVDRWRLQLAASQTIDPVFKDNVTTAVQVRSDEALNIVFDPSLLLALGDLIAYKDAAMPPTVDVAEAVKAASAEQAAQEGRAGAAAAAGAADGTAAAQNASGRSDGDAVTSPSAGRGQADRPGRTASENAAPDATVSAPPLEEQMALGAPVTSRVPRRYVIHNMTGCSLYYWSGAQEVADSRLASKHHLPHNRSEELQVEPQQEKCRIVGRGDVAQSSYDSAVINLKFDGNWSPILKVALDVVGKYRYQLSTPRRDYTIPLIVDVALVGRTKVIRLHSSLYVQNTTNFSLSFSLHLPSPFLTYSITPTPGDKLVNDYELLLRRMAPGHGFYLPLMACMDGVLALKPDRYQASQHDVIRLSRDLETMWDQQGYMLCQPKDRLSGLRPISFCVKINSSDIDYMRRNYDSPSPGEFRQAIGAMEASIQVTPTVELSNSLPYAMKGYVLAIRKPEDQAKEQLQQQQQQQQQEELQQRKQSARGAAFGGAGGTDANASALPGGAAAAAGAGNGPSPVTGSAAVTTAAAVGAAAGTSAFAPMSQMAQPLPGGVPPRAHHKLSMPAIPASPRASRASLQFSEVDAANPADATAEGLRAGGSEITPAPPAATGAGSSRARRRASVSVVSSGRLASSRLGSGRRRGDGGFDSSDTAGYLRQTSALDRAESKTLAITTAASGVANSVKAKVELAGATMAQAGVTVAGVVTAAGTKAVGEIASRLQRQTERQPSIFNPEDEVGYEVAVSSFGKLADLLGKKPGVELLYSVGHGVRRRLKHQMLRAVRSSLKWVFKNAGWRDLGIKELEPMFPRRSDAEMEKFDTKVEWVKLHELFEYLLHCLHPFQLAPGQSKSFYVDLTYTVMLAVKVPDLSLKTDRPCLLNVSDPLLLLTDSTHDSGLEARQRRMLHELPRVLRLHKNRESRSAPEPQPDILRQDLMSLANVPSTASTMLAFETAAGVEARRAYDRAATLPDFHAAAMIDGLPEGVGRIGSSAAPMTNAGQQPLISPWDMAAFARRLEVLHSFETASSSNKKQKPKTYKAMWGRAVVKDRLRSSFKDKEKEREKERQKTHEPSPPRVSMSSDKGVDSPPLVKVTLVAQPKPPTQEGANTAAPETQVSVELSYPDPAALQRRSMESMPSQTEVLEKRPTRILDFWKRVSTSHALPGPASASHAGPRQSSGGGGDGSMGGSRGATGSPQFSVPFGGAPTVDIEMSGQETEGMLSGPVLARRSVDDAEPGPVQPAGKPGGSRLGDLLGHLRRQARGQQGTAAGAGSSGAEQGRGFVSSPSNVQVHSEKHLEAIKESVGDELEGSIPMRQGPPAASGGGASGTANAGSGTHKEGKLAAAWRAALTGSASSSSPAPRPAPAGQSPLNPASASAGAGAGTAAPAPAPAAVLPATPVGVPVLWDNNPAYSRSPTPTPPSSIGRTEAAAAAGALTAAQQGQPAAAPAAGAPVPGASSSPPVHSGGADARRISTSSASGLASEMMSLPTFGSSLKAIKGLQAASQAADAAGRSPVSRREGAPGAATAMSRLPSSDATAQGSGSEPSASYTPFAPAHATPELSPFSPLAALQGKQGDAVSGQPPATVFSPQTPDLLLSCERPSMEAQREHVSQSTLGALPRFAGSNRFSRSAQLSTSGRRLDDVVANLASTSVEHEQGSDVPPGRGGSTGNFSQLPGGSAPGGSFRTGSVVIRRGGEALVSSTVRAAHTAVEVAGHVVGTTVGATQTVTEGAGQVLAGGRKAAEDVTVETKRRVKIGVWVMQWGITKAISKTAGRRRSAAASAALDHEDQAPAGGALARAINQRKQDMERTTRGVERLCPAEVLLGINNSMATDADFSCQVKVYSAFWVDNRTGLDLIFKDMDVPPVLANVPFLVYEEVLAPAVKVDRPPPQLDYDADDADENEEAQLDGQQGSPRSTIAHALEEEEDETDYAALAEETHCIALLNEQSIMSFKLQDGIYGDSKYCTSFKAHSVGQKSIVLRGPRKKLDPPVQTTVWTSESVTGSGPPSFGRSCSLTQTSGSTRGPEPPPVGPSHCQRLFCFAVEVWNPPPSSLFKHSKIITVKNRYIIRNETGFTIQYKQFGTPDPGACEYGYGQRFAGDLESNCSIGFHWDNDEGSGVRKELVIRPSSDWHWSGSFPLAVKEQYFSLKIRRINHTQFKIIPVNITVGASGSLLITLKSNSSMSNYMVLNLCRDIVINLRQKTPEEDDELSHKQRVGWDVFDPDPLKHAKLVPFAWDEPNEDHVLEIVAANADKEYMSELVKRQHMEQKERERQQREAAGEAGGSRRTGASAGGAAGGGGGETPPYSRWVPYTRLPEDQVLTLDIRELRNRARENDKPYKELQITTREMRPQPTFNPDINASATTSDTPRGMGPSAGPSMHHASHRADSLAFHRATPSAVMRENSIVASLRFANLQPHLQRSGTALHRGFVGERAEKERTQPMYTKKVYVKLYYDGPTEVLCFSEEPPSMHSENRMAESLLQQLLMKLQMLYKQLTSTDRLLAKLGVARDDIEMKQEEAQPVVPASPRIRFMDSSGRRRSFAQHDGEAGLVSYGSGAPHLPGHANKVYARLGRLLKEVQFGGDVKVLVRQARGLLSVGKGMQLFAQVAVGEEMKAVDVLAQLTGSIGQFEWNKEVLLRDIYSAGELRVLVWAVPDSTQTEKMRKGKGLLKSKEGAGASLDDSDDWGVASMWKSRPITALKPPMLGATLVGVAEVSLVDTIQAQQQRQREKQQRVKQRRQSTLASGANAVISGGGAAEDAERERELEQSAQWYPLRRWEGNKAVKGEIELSLEWTFTKTGKLQQQIRLLDMVLAEKMELVAALTPVMPWVAKDSLIDLEAAAKLRPQGGRHSAGPGGPQGAASAAPVRPKKLPTHWETAEAVEKARDTGRSAAHAAAEAEGQVLGQGPTVQQSVAQVELRQDRYQVNLEVSVLEVHNLAPREGLTAKFINHLKGVQVSLGVSKMLPRARVELRVGSQSVMQAVPSPSLNPVLPKNSSAFTDVELKQNLEVKVYDRMLSLCGAEQLRTVGSAALPLACIPNTDPIYVWVPLKRTKMEQQAMLKSRDTSPATGDLAVFLRLQLAKPQARGVSLGIDADLQGLGLMAKSSVNELFHFTLKRVQGTWMLTPVEGLVYLSVQTLQLDNQLMDTQRPVVLSPSNTPSHQNSKDLAMRGFAVGDSEDRAPIINLVVQRRFAGTPRSRVMQVAGTPHNQNEIVSIKKFHLEIQPLDFVTDQEFFEEVYMFLHTLPLANLWQDKQWQAEMDASQGMPRISSNRNLPGVRSGPTRTTTPPKGTFGPATSQSPNRHPAAAPGSPDGADTDDGAITLRVAGTGDGAHRSRMSAALHWLVDKERNELQVMRGQSSTWFMLHDFHISALDINITLALNSNLGQGMGAKGGPGGPGGQAVPSRGGRANIASSKGVMRGMLSRISGEDGFQLVNVTNAPIQLQAFQLKESESWLVNRVAFWHLFVRHYTSTGLTEARKILGGAGPAVATLLASAIWASISLVDLGQEVVRRRKPPSALVTGFFFYTLTSFGQMLGVLPRMLASLMAFLPVQREGWLSDSETLQRMTARPQTLVDALYSSNRDFLHALTLALAGLLLDPYEGARLPGYWAIPGVAAGLVKAAVGLGLRPTIGFLEFCSRNIQGIGLAFQGKQGIQGKLIRRVSAPGAPMQNVVSWTAEQEAEARRANINAAWQQQLHWLEPAMASDKVLDVLQCRFSRVALLTDRHIAYLYARQQHTGDGDAGTAEAYTFKVKWFLPIHQIDNIRAVDKSLRITIDYRKPFSLGKMLSMRLQLHKGMRCSTEEAHRNLILRLNLHIRRTLSAGQDQRAKGDGERLLQDGADLSIVNPA